MTFPPALLERARAALATGRPVRYDKLAAPITNAGKIFGSGPNYLGHGKEDPEWVPAEEPQWDFIKLTSSVIGPYDDIVLPSGNHNVDWEAEMALAIGIEAKRVNTNTFAIGCGLAGFAGAVLLPIVPATPSMGFAFVIKAFLTVVVAGPVTLTGSVDCRKKPPIATKATNVQPWLSDAAKRNGTAQTSDKAMTRRAPYRSAAGPPRNPAFMVC